MRIVYDEDYDYYENLMCKIQRALKIYFVFIQMHLQWEPKLIQWEALDQT